MRSFCMFNDHLGVGNGGGDVEEMCGSAFEIPLKKV